MLIRMDYKMLTKTDLKLFQILDKEIDKALSWGCIVKIRQKRSTGRSKIIYDYIYSYTKDGYWKHKYNIQFANYKYCGSSYITCINLNSGNFCIHLGYDSEKKVRKVDCFNTIGHYPTTNEVLRYIDKKYLRKGVVIMNCESGEIITDGGRKIFTLDITKPIGDYTDEKKLELLNFLETIK